MYYFILLWISSERGDESDNPAGTWVLAEHGHGDDRIRASKMAEEAYQDFCERFDCQNVVLCTSPEGG